MMFLLQKNWTDANKYCWEDGKKLVFIDSAEENDWIVDKIKELGKLKSNFKNVCLKIR